MPFFLIYFLYVSIGNFYRILRYGFAESRVCLLVHLGVVRERPRRATEGSLLR